MEEMMNSTSTQSPSNQSSPPWKLYPNPLYTHQEPQLPTYKSRASSSAVPFIMETMTKSIEEARAQIMELKDELEFERRLRKKMEWLMKMTTSQLEEERRRREAAERACEELGDRVSSHKAELDRIRREMDDERKMLKVAEVFREERVQMKLTDAKIFYEQKLLRLEQTDQQDNDSGGGGGGGGGGVGGFPENPHIKRGIKGSVEFQRVVRALCSNKSNRHLGVNYKLECQKAQLKILLKQRSPLRPNSLVLS